MKDTLAELIEQLREERDTDATPGNWTEVVRLPISDRLGIGSAQFVALWLKDGAHEEGRKWVGCLRPEGGAEVAIWVEQGRKKEINALALAFGGEGKLEELGPYVTTQDHLVLFDRSAALEAWRFGGPDASASIQKKSPMPDQVAQAQAALEKEGLRTPTGLYRGITDEQLARASLLVQKSHPDLSMALLTTQTHHDVDQALSKTPLTLLSRDKAEPWALALTPSPQWGDFWRAHAVSARVWIIDFQGENEFEAPSRAKKTAPKKAAPNKAARKKTAPKKAAPAKKKTVPKKTATKQAAPKKRSP